MENKKLLDDSLAACDAGNYQLAIKLGEKNQPAFMP